MITSRACAKALTAAVLLVVAGCSGTPQVTSSPSGAASASMTSGPGQAMRPSAVQGSSLTIRPVLLELPEASSENSPGSAITITTRPGAPTSASDLAWLTPQVLAAVQTLRCGRGPAAETSPGLPSVACSADGMARYVLGPAELTGQDLTAVSPETADGAAPGQALVAVQLTTDGTRKLGEATTRLVNLPAPRNHLAIVVDSVVVGAPTVMSVIDGGILQIAPPDTLSAADLAARIRAAS